MWQIKIQTVAHGLVLAFANRVRDIRLICSVTAKKAASVASTDQRNATRGPTRGSAKATPAT